MDQDGPPVYGVQSPVGRGVWEDIAETWIGV